MPSGRRGLAVLAVNHPDFYYPDLRTHARLVEKVQEEGFGFFVSPSRAIWEHPELKDEERFAAE